MPGTDKDEWWPDAADSAVTAYMNAHVEFDWAWFETGRPYSGARWSDYFRSIPNSDEWKLRRDHISNSVTADLIAAAELLAIHVDQHATCGGPGSGSPGMSASIWIPLLDGGLDVEFMEWEDQYTNKAYGRQETLVSGPRALRCLLDFLGFDPPKGSLKGESKVTPLEEIQAELDRERDESSPKHAAHLRLV